MSPFHPKLRDSFQPKPDIKTVDVTLRAAENCSMRISIVVAVLLAATGSLGGCTGVHHYTYEIEYTTDRQPHTVQLWYDEGQGSGEQPAYSLTFPQSYYAYRDNHEAEKQT